MKELITPFLDAAIAIRRELHQIPELKYEEWQTSAFIASTLKSYGYEVQEGVGKTGIVAVLDSQNPGKTIAFRADIDALPIEEATSVPYKSKHSKVMHACGHDGHTATLLLVARVLQEIKPQLKGKIKLIFQPAEEGGKGSTAMIEDSFSHLSKLLNGRQRISAFRAGSWGIVSEKQSSKPLMQALEKVGIQMEVSICNGLRYYGESLQLNYDDLPCPYTPYYPDYDDPRKVSSHPTKVVEVPTQSLPRTFKIKLAEKIISKLFRPASAVQGADPIKQLPDHITKDPFGFRSGAAKEDCIFDFSAERHLIVFQIMMDQIVQRALKEPGDVSFLVLENHTKSLQTEKHFEKIKKLISYTQKKWGKYVHFVTLQDMADHLNLIEPKMQVSQYATL